MTRDEFIFAQLLAYITSTGKIPKIIPADIERAERNADNLAHYLEPVKKPSRSNNTKA